MFAEQYQKDRMCTGGGGNAEDQIMDAERGFRVAYLLLGTQTLGKRVGG